MNFKDTLKGVLNKEKKEKVSSTYTAYMPSSTPATHPSNYFTVTSYPGSGTDSVTTGTAGFKPETVTIKDAGSQNWAIVTSYTHSNPDETILDEFDEEMREQYPTLEKAYQNYLNIRKLLK